MDVLAFRPNDPDEKKTLLFHQFSTYDKEFSSKSIASMTCKVAGSISASYENSF
jgi:hypothetical protein